MKLGYLEKALPILEEQITLEAKRRQAADRLKGIVGKHMPNKGAMVVGMPTVPLGDIHPDVKLGLEIRDKHGDEITNPRIGKSAIEYALHSGSLIVSKAGEGLRAFTIQTEPPNVLGGPRLDQPLGVAEIDGVIESLDHYEASLGNPQT